MKKQKNTITLPKIDENEIKDLDIDLDELIITPIDVYSMDNGNGIKNRKIEIGCRKLIILGYETLKNAMIHINQVNFNKPKQRNLFSIFNGIPLEDDFRSPSTLLYLQLTNMKNIKDSLDQVQLQIDTIKKVISDQIKAIPHTTNEEDNIQSIEMQQGSNKLKELEELKIKILKLKEHYNTVLSHPTIESFYQFWESYKKDTSKKHQYN